MIRAPILSVILFFILCLGHTFLTAHADNHASRLQLEYVEEIEVNEQFSGMKVIAEDLRISKSEILNFNKDGTVVSKIGDQERKGFWYTDPRGKHCIRWDDKDKSSCAEIMRDDDGNWVKVKDDVIIKKYESFDKLNQSNQQKNKKKINIEKGVIRF